MNVPAYRDVINARTACMRCDITCPSTCSHVSCGYPTKAWLIYACINYSARGNACAYWYVLRFSHHVASYIDSYMYAVCIIKLRARAVVCSRDYPRSKNDDHDDDKMNTLAFVNFLLVKFFPTLIRQYFPPSKFCAIRYIVDTI